MLHSKLLLSLLQPQLLCANTFMRRIKVLMFNIPINVGTKIHITRQLLPIRCHFLYFINSSACVNALCMVCDLNNLIACLYYGRNIFSKMAVHLLGNQLIFLMTSSSSLFHSACNQKIRLKIGHLSNVNRIWQSFR